MPASETTAPPRPIGLPPGIEYEAAGQDAAKYDTTNPVVRRLIARLMGSLARQLAPHPGLLVDVGIGEGLAAERAIVGRATVVGVEYRADKLGRARERLEQVAPVVGDAGMLPIGDGRAPVTTCLEVLEHLTEPERAVVELARVTGDVCVVSVPWEPWFRLGNLARGKNVRRFGNDVEHIQAFDRGSLRRLLSAGFEEVEVHGCFPWLIGVGRRARTGATA